MLARILLIDDDPSGLLSLAELLQRRLGDVSVETALDVNAALDLLREKDYHVVISDIRMAGLDGLAALNQVKERWPQVPVILVTAGGRDREDEASRYGAYAFIEKPMSEEQLLPTVQSAIERSVMLYRVEEANRRSQFRLQFEADRLDRRLDLTLGRRLRDDPEDQEEGS